MPTVPSWLADRVGAESGALPLSLPELLRRCHRDELLPLCTALRVNPQGLGLGKLAENLTTTLRRTGGNELSNILLRKGEGPPYSELLAALAERCGVPVEPDPEATEQALLRWWVGNRLLELGPDQRAAAWSLLGIDGAPPPVEETALTRAGGPGSITHPERVVRVVGALAARVIVFFLMPLMGPILGITMAMNLAKPKDGILLPAVLEVARLRQVVRHRVTIGIVGSPSAGKDAAIKAVFGIDTGNVNPVAGSTRSVTIQRLPGATALFVVNTPGLGDVVAAVTEEARQVLDHIDVYVYLVNAQGGVQARELADWRHCQESGRPALVVVNKIDTLRESDRTRYLADARGKLGAPAEDFLSAAFDPLPQLSPAPIGVAPVRAWLHAQLHELGKDPGELPWDREGNSLPPPTEAAAS